MKIKTLLTALALVWGLPSIYGQQATVEENVPLSTVHFPLHKAPPRKEIRHTSSQQQDYDFQPSTARASGEYIMTEFPTMGEIKGIVILAAFADVPFSVSADSINKLLSKRFNADDYSEEIHFDEYSNIYGKNLDLEVTIPGSARDYFKTQSFGQFAPSFDVVGPVILDNNRAHYGANNSSGNDKNTAGMISDACEKANTLGLVDFSNYDNDGDGIVDIVYVVYAGSDEAQTGIEEAIWAKASSRQFTISDSIKIGRYACSGELVIDLPVVAGIGTFVHEFSHVLGLPDFYNTNSNCNKLTMDMWSVMDYGMYNAEGFVPSAYTSFERYSLDWIPMHTLDQPATMSIGSTEDEGKGYRIFTSAIDSTAADTASFYVIENIRKEGWNRYAPNSGLLISEVTYNATAWKNNKVNTETSHRHLVVPANNWWKFPQSSGDKMPDYTPPLHLFGNTNHEFTATSTPASITQFGVTMDKSLTDIRYDAATGRTSFLFRGGNPENGVDSPLNPQPLTEVYDLLGRPVANPTKGIYIVNGKKVVIR